MSRPLCDEIMLRSVMGRGYRHCYHPAKWWVAVPFAEPPARPVCGVHARAYTQKWPMVSADQAADRRLMEELVALARAEPG